VIGIAQTGTGKTAAFAVPILHHLLTNRRRPKRKTCRVLVLSPTRELSGQILDSFRAYGRHVGTSAALVIGGVSMGARCARCRTESTCSSPRPGACSTS
jgi:superfamily II DNA/RNA helicase